MKIPIDSEDKATLASALFGAIGAALWAHNPGDGLVRSIGAGMLVFVVLLMGIARAMRR
jgi:hypothetical protein